MKYFLVVGETSGDQHAAGLMKAIQRSDESPTFAFMGGPAMRSVGGTCVVSSEEMAFMGFVDVVKNYKTIERNAKKVQEFFTSYRPDIVICVDYAGFCFRYILPFVKENLPQTFVTYYIPPKVWAWKKHRVNMLRSHTDLILTIFPFEVTFFKQENLPHAVYVGNPSLEQIEKFEETDTIAPTDKPYIAILCGSRESEVRKNLPTMLDVCRHFPNHEIVIAGAPALDKSLYEPFIAGNHRIKLVFGQTLNILRHSNAALVTSGTATLETGLLKIPQVVCYSIGGGRLANFVFEHFFKVPYISLVNLIADRMVVKELYGAFFKEKYITGELDKILTDPSYRSNMIDEYKEVRAQLRTSKTHSQMAAEVIIYRFQEKHK